MALHAKKKRASGAGKKASRPVYAVWQAGLDQKVALRLLDRGLVQIQTRQLLDFLAEFLAIEKGAVSLYDSALERTEAPELRAALLDYRLQTEHHSDLIEAMIRDLGGNPSFTTPPALVYVQRTRALLSLDVPEDYQEIASLDSLLTVVTKLHSCWAFLRSVIPHLDNPHARELGEQLLLEVSDQEEEQLDWVRQALSRSLMRRAMPGAPPAED